MSQNSPIITPNKNHDGVLGTMWYMSQFILVIMVLTHRHFSSSPIVGSNRTSNHSGRTCFEELCSPIAPKQVEKDSSCNMRSIVDPIATTTITSHPFYFKIIRAAVRAAIILDNLTRTEKMESGWQPYHIKYCKDSVRNEWKDYKGPNFSNNLGSNLGFSKISQKKLSVITHKSHEKHKIINRYFSLM